VVVGHLQPVPLVTMLDTKLNTVATALFFTSYNYCFLTEQMVAACANML